MEAMWTARVVDRVARTAQPTLLIPHVCFRPEAVIGDAPGRRCLRVRPAPEGRCGEALAEPNLDLRAELYRRRAGDTAQSTSTTTHVD